MKSCPGEPPKRGSRKPEPPSSLYTRARSSRRRGSISGVTRQWADRPRLMPGASKARGEARAFDFERPPGRLPEPLVRRDPTSQRDTRNCRSHLHTAKRVARESLHRG